MRRFTIALAFAFAVLPPVPGRSAPVGPCPGVAEATTPTVVTGTFGKGVQGSYVWVPFQVPAGSTRVRVKLCYDQPDVPIAVPGVVSVKNTLDLGIYHATTDGFFDADEFRGWGGSSRPNVLITPEQATLGFKPGPIPAGSWAAEIGVAAVSGPTEGDLDSKVNWRLEFYTAVLSSDLEDPWTPTAYDETPANPAAGWYKGDMHVHAEHSNPADATMREAFDYGFGTAGLDFFTLSDYVTNRHWDEIGRFQADYPGRLIIRSSEVITYRGHVNNHASLGWADYRTGTIYVHHAGGGLEILRGPRPASRIFDDIHTPLDGAGAPRGWTQVNHPTIFPSQVPAFGNFCRGCSWSYSDAETDWSKVDAFEVSTGPGGTQSPKGDELGPNPFTPLAIAMYDHIRSMGFDVTAVGSSDSHKAGGSSLTSAPIGVATTVVYANELSEPGIRDGILAGHAYVKFFDPHGPDLRFTAQAATGGPTAMMGDTLATTGTARFTARVFNVAASVQPRVLLVLRDGLPILAFPVTKNDQTFRFTGVLPGDYRLQLMRGTAFEALANPITLAAP